MTTKAYMADVLYPQVTNKALEMIKMTDIFIKSLKYLLKGLAYEVAGDIGRYASLVYGMSQVVGEKPEIDKAIFAGIAYGIASYFSRAGNVLKIGGMLRALSHDLSQSDLEEKIGGKK